MVLETVLSGLGGGLLRMLPEALKFLDRKGDRKHELQMFDKQIALTQLQQQGTLAVAEVQADASTQAAWLEAVRDASVAQAKSTGIAVVDAISATVRPIVTYLFVLMWMAVKVAAYAQISETGLEWDKAVLSLWGEQDHVIFSGIISFWFMSRVIEKRT
jgi:hypothetical protein